MEPTTQPVVAQVNVVLDKLNEIGHNIADGAKPLAERVVNEYATAHWLMAGVELALVITAVVFCLMFLRKTIFFAKTVDRLYDKTKHHSNADNMADLCISFSFVSGALALTFAIVGIVAACYLIGDLGKAAAPTYNVLKGLF